MTTLYNFLLYSNGARTVRYDGGTGNDVLAYEEPAALLAISKIVEVIKNTYPGNEKMFFVNDENVMKLGYKAFMATHLNALSVYTTKDPNIGWVTMPRGPDTSAQYGMANNYYFWAFTTTIGDDWKDVVTAAGAFFTRDYDYIRYPELSVDAIWNKTAWQDANRATWPAPGVIEHLGSLIFDGRQGPACVGGWAALNARIADTVLEDIVMHGVNAQTALDSHRSEIQAEFDSLVAPR
jgi:hypothetical protein